MLKRTCLVILFWALVLAACAPTSPATTPVVPATEGALTTQPAGQTASTRLPGCTVVSRKPTTGPTEDSLLPPPGEKDWVKGPADAAVTFIDYSDFQ